MRFDRSTTLVFLACWIIYAGHFATNVVREHYPAFAFAERGTLRVDPYLGLHDDIFFIEGRGAFINNNPGASMLGAVPYALTRPLIDIVVERVAAARAADGVPPTNYYDHPREDFRDYFRKVRAQGLDVRFGLAAAAMTALLMAPLSALSVVVMFRLLGLLAFPPRSRWPLALLYGFATPVFLRTAFLNQNLLVAHFALFAFALLLADRSRAPQPSRAAAAGLLAGMALLCDYTAIVVVPPLGLYCLWRCMRPVRCSDTQQVGALRGLTPVAAMAAAAAIPVAVLLAYQAWAFGNPIWPAQHYMPPDPYGDMGWHGFAGLDPELLYENLLGLRFGLLPAAPLLALTLGLAVPALRTEALRHVGPAELWLAAAMLVCLLLLAAATQFARHQWETGVRYLVPAVPFLFLPAAAVLVAMPRRVALGVAALALFQSWSLAMVRADPLTSILTVLSDGPQLPWLTTLSRMGDQYGPAAAAIAERPAIVVAALAVGPIAMLWSALRSSTNGERHP
jgi:hypothetical protein